MITATAMSRNAGPELAGAEQMFQAFAPHLWPWTGWFAVMAADRFVGVFPTLMDALAAGQSDGVDPATVLVRRIGSDTAVPIPSDDGSDTAPPWVH